MNQWVNTNTASSAGNITITIPDFIKSARERKRERDREYQERRRKKLVHLKRWEGMKARCLNPDHKSFDDYGGRGIKIHPPWINSFKLFDTYLKKNLGDCPQGYTLDRIDNDGDYRPGNLRWADPRQQSFNKGREVR